MKKQHTIAGLVIAAMLAGAGYGLYAFGMQRGIAMSASPNAAALVTQHANTDAKTDPQTGRKVLYWHDPMVPGQKFDKPGKSPFMDMELVPVYANETGDESGVSISPQVQQNLGIRTAEASKTALSQAIEAVGSVAYNERDVALVQARSNGFVERLSVRAPLDPIKKGQALMELYVPDWVAAQEEYLSVKNMRAAGMAGLVDGAKQRMRLVGMTDAQIQQVETSGKVHARMTVTSPMSGVVSELTVREGMTVTTGAALLRINGLKTVWVNAEIPESMTAHVKPGNQVEARAAALPGTVFIGKVSALLPEIDPVTRTIKARIELANPKQQLVPGMFATINFAPAAREEVVTVPSEAVIQTGKRSVVMVALGGGKFAPVDVEIGLEVNGKTEIRKGLEAGQNVVTSGQFLIDSEASLKGTIARMDGMPGATEQNQGQQDRNQTPTHRGQGKVESIDEREVTLSHGPIPMLKWGEMTMGFPLAKGVDPGKLKVGDAVTFEVRATPDGMYEIVSIARAAGTPANAPKDKTRNSALRGDRPEGRDMDGAMPMPGISAGAAK